MRIPLEKAKPGMILGEDILMPNGVVLVHCSSELTQSVLDVLKRRNIESLDIVDESDIPDPTAGEGETHEENPHDKNGQGDPIPVSEPEPEPEPEPQKPGLSVVLSSDNMSANLIIEPAETSNEQLCVDDVLDVLFENNIVSGFNKEVIAQAVSSYLKKRQSCEIKEIAKGRLPRPGKEGLFNPCSNVLTTKAQIEKVHQATYFWEIAEEGLNADRVDSGTVIAERLSDTPPEPGENILGETLTTNELVRTSVTVTDTAEMENGGRRVIARCTGIPFFANNTIGVIPLDFNGTCEIAITPDSMRGEIHVHPAGVNGGYPSIEEIVDILSDKGIVYGIQKEHIRELSKSLTRKTCPKAPVCVAQGIPPEHGRNGTIEFLFPTETSLRPKQNSDGSVDYKSVDIVHVVEKGQELARLVPPTSGTPGKDIFGNVIPCSNGSPAILPRGANTEIHPENSDCLIAVTDGNVSFNGTVVEVQEGLVVPTDVDYSMGNITYEKSVVVGNDIKAGFRVECGGDLQVGGTIEDAEVYVNGNALCKFGFIGQGKGIVKCKGDVNVGFMKNQTIHCWKNVVVAREALNATIYARHSISVLGKPLSVAGGTLIARDFVDVYTIGNMSGVKTSVEAGMDFTLAEEQVAIEQQIKEMEEHMKKIHATLARFDRLLALKKRLSPSDEKLNGKLRKTLTKFQEKSEELLRRKKTLALKMTCFDKAYIKIEHAAHPGTTIKIGDSYHVVRNEIVGPKIVKAVDHELKFM